MGLEPSDVGQRTGPVNPYLMQQHPMPSQELIVDTQKFVRSNPGLFEDLHKCTRDLAPTCFDGLKVMLNKGLSQHFQVSHSFTLPMSTPGRYAFSSTYVGFKEVRVQEASPVLMAEMDNSGNLNFQGIYFAHSTLRSRAIVQTQQSFWNVIQFDQTYYGENITAVLTVVNPNFKNLSGIIHFSMLARLHQRVDAGFEMFTQKSPVAPTMSFTTLGLRVNGGTASVQKNSPFGIVYPTPKWTAIISAGLNGIRLGYHRNCSEHIQSAVELEYSTQAKTGEASFSYQIDIPKSGFTFKSGINTSLTLSTVVEKRMKNLPINFHISASLGYAKKNSVVGLGVYVG